MPRTVSYGELEGALAALLRVDADRLLAFRARIRHFRSLGVPNVARAGSGTKSAYPRLAAAELAVALRLATLGVAPGAAAQIVLSRWLRDAIAAFDELLPRRGAYLICPATNPWSEREETAERAVYAFGEEALAATLRECGEAAAIVDLGSLMEVLDKALALEQGAPGQPTPLE